MAPKGIVLLVVVAGLYGAVRCFALGELSQAFRGVVPSLVGVLIVWAFVSTMWAPDPLRSLSLSFRLALLSCAGLIVVHAATTLTTPARKSAQSCVAVGGAIAVSILFVAVLAAKLGITASDHLVRWNRGASVIALAVFPVVATLLASHRKGVAILVPLLVLALLTQLDSNAAIVALCLGSACFVLAMAAPRVGPMILAGLFAVSILLMPQAIALLSSFADVQALYSALPPSAVHRVEIWNFTISQIDARPILGWGMDASRHMAAGRTVMNGQELMPLHPHNGALQLRVELGILGALLAAAIAAWVAGSSSRLRSQSRLAAGTRCATVCSYLAVGSLSYGVWQNWWVAVAWVIGSQFIFAQPARDERPNSNSRA